MENGTNYHQVNGLKRSLALLSEHRGEDASPTKSQEHRKETAAITDSTTIADGTAETGANGKESKVHLSLREKGKIDSLMSSLSRCESDIMAKKTRVDAAHRYVPPIVQETLREITCQVTPHVALCEAVQESGECDDYQGMLKTLEDFNKDYTEGIA